MHIQGLNDIMDTVLCLSKALLYYMSLMQQPSVNSKDLPTDSISDTKDNGSNKTKKEDTCQRKSHLQYLNRRT